MRIDVRWRFWLAVGFQFVILLALTGAKQSTVWTGQTIRLDTVPVDPRSLFRGDYVILRYEISAINLAGLEVDFDDVKLGDAVYVVLSNSYGDWRPSGVFKSKPDLAPGQVMLRGDVTSVRGSPTLGPIVVAYGIENYFVPEGTGRSIERMTGGELDVEVVVDRRGNGVVRRLFIDGMPFDP